MKTRVALVQPRYPEEGTASAAQECTAWMMERLDELRPGAVELIVLPEYSTTPGLVDPEEMWSFAREHGEQLQAVAAAQARRLGAWVCVGSLHRGGGRAVNRTFLHGPAGELATYDKVHLTETETDLLGLQPGEGPVVIVAAGSRLGFLTCFDVYFAEHAEALASLGARLIVHPSYQRSESANRIRLLCATRALDTGAYLLRSSYARPGRGAGGHTLVAAPDGQVLADLGDEPGVLAATIEPERGFVKPAAHGLPEMEHRSLLEARRRPPAYRPHLERVAALERVPFPRVCAHRGIPGTCPENTLPSFAAAVASGAEEVEFDLRLSADGVAVVCHDGNLQRTTGRNALVADLPWEEIAALDASHGRGPEWRPTPVPRFEQVLELVGGRVGLNIHLKDPGPGGRLVTTVAGILRSRGLTRSAHIAGEQEVLAAAADLCPEIGRACLAGQAEPERQVETATRYRCARVQFGRSATDAALAEARARGMIRNLFYSDDAEGARGWVRRGIDVILTNHAHRIASAGLGS